MRSKLMPQALTLNLWPADTKDDESEFPRIRVQPVQAPHVNEFVIAQRPTLKGIQRLQCKYGGLYKGCHMNNKGTGAYF
jgi:hypothetical protein